MARFAGGAILTIAVCVSAAAEVPADCGAKVPFVTYEAEASTTNGKVVRMEGLPAPNEASPEIEASGRSYVKLARTGEHCEFAAAAAGNALVLRHCISDAPTGGGTAATLSLYVNGKFRQKLPLDSRYNWLYGEASSAHGGQFNDPDAGRPRVFWNDTRFLCVDNAWQAGDVLRLQKDADDTPEYYSLDLVDLEMAPPPLAPPDDEVCLSIVDFGATGDDEIDDTNAIRECISAAKKQGKTVWFPAGRFHHSEAFELEGVQVQGAGMWHTELLGTGRTLGFVLTGNRPRVADLFLESLIHQTRNDPGGMTFRSRDADRWSIERVWMTHIHCGMWLSDASRGVLRDSRIYCTYADAVNLNRGSSHNLVEHNYIRGAGDDGIASLALLEHQAITESNTLRRNTVVANWWGHNIDIAGGRGHLVESNYLADNSHSGCFTFNLPSAYPMHALTNAIVRRNSIVRGGGNHAGQRRGAVWSFADDASISGIVFEENKIVAPIFRGLHLHGRAEQEILFKNNLIESPGEDAVRIDESARGRLTMSANQIRNLKPGHRAIDNASGAEFEVVESQSRID